MNTLVIYASLHGCTKKCAQYLSNNLIGNVTTLNLKGKKSIDLSMFSNIIIGGSIHTGYINPVIFQFCKNNLDMLLKKNIGLYLCFMDQAKKFEYYLQKSFPDNLLHCSKVKGYFGGELDFSKLTFFEKLYIQKTTKFTKSVSKFNKSSIDNFCKKMNKFIGAN